MKRGAMVGALVGAVSLSLAGVLLGILIEAVKDLPSGRLGTSVVTKGVVLWTFGAAAVGIILGAPLGMAVTALNRNANGVLIGLIIGASVLALGGALLGTFKEANSPLDYSRVINFTLIGAVVGAIVGILIGAIAERFFGISQKAAS